MKTKNSLVIVTLSLLLLFILAYFFVMPEEKKTEPFFENTKDLIAHIKKAQESGHLKEFTFVQETIRFNDSGIPLDTTTWYEAIRYPKEFRIDFGNPKDGNANINRNDSIYVFRNHELVHSGPEVQEFLILEGGIFYYPIDETLNRLQNLGVNTDVFTTSTYKENPIYIIGAAENDLEKPQIWLDADEFYVVRRFSKGNQNALYEVRCDDFQENEGHIVETWVEFLVNGQLIQTERYNNVDVTPNLTYEVFDPEAFGAYYWFDQ